MLDWLQRLTGTGPASSASIPPHSSASLPGADPFPGIPVEIDRREVIGEALGLFAAAEFGAVRVLSTLGWTVREFPTLPWHDATRAEAGIPPGLLEPISCGRWIGIHGCLLPSEALPLEEIDAHRRDLPYDLSGGRWFARLEIPRSQAASLHQLLDEMEMSWTFALLLDPDPDARAVLRRTDKPGAPAIMLGQGPLAGSVRIALNQVDFSVPTPATAASWWRTGSRCSSRNRR